MEVNALSQIGREGVGIIALAILLLWVGFTLIIGDFVLMLFRADSELGWRAFAIGCGLQLVAIAVVHGVWR